MSGNSVATQTLADFLLARIAEDEAVAREAQPGPWYAVRGDIEALHEGRRTAVVGGDYQKATDPDTAEHVARHDPARVLAECEAKRRIVELHPIHGWKRGSCDTCTDRDYVGLVDEGPCDTLKALALPYADHPDFRQEWRA